MDDLTSGHGPAGGPARPGARHGEEADGLHLHLLEAFALTRGDEAVAVPRIAQRLVALLAVSGRALDRARVAGLLWGGVPEDRAAASLRCALWRLRKVPLRIVKSSGSQLQLDPAVEVDVRTASAKAERLLGRSGGPRAGDDQPGLLVHDLLEDWYDDWLLMERERFRQLRLHALEALCARLLDERRHAEAIEAGIAAVSGEPFRDSAQRVLVKAYVAEGNVGEALRQFRIYKELLARNGFPEPSFSVAQVEDEWRRHRSGVSDDVRSLLSRTLVVDQERSRIPSDPRARKLT